MREAHAPSVWRGSAQDSPYTSGGVYHTCMCVCRQMCISEPVCAGVHVLRQILWSEGDNRYFLPVSLHEETTLIKQMSSMCICSNECQTLMHIVAIMAVGDHCSLQKSVQALSAHS